MPEPARKPLPLLVETLGCRVNQYESDGLYQGLLSTGRFSPSDPDHPPGIILLNSCTVTDQADSRNRYTIRRLKRLYPEALLVVTGCYAQTDGKFVASLEGVDLVVGNHRKSALPELLLDWMETRGVPPAGTNRYTNRMGGIRTDAGLDRSFQLERPFDYGHVTPVGHTRAYLKIQDGCDRLCTYCKVPSARGRGISRDRRGILEHLRVLRDAGVPEVVLTGINLGAWRGDYGAEGRGGIVSLIEEMLELGGDFRIRISSIEPNDITKDLARLSLHPRFCNFLHVPVQSGSATVLRRMKRPSTKRGLLERLEMALSINPDLFPGTDVMVGFPGETEAEFQETLELCERVGFANIHVFIYSPRRGTPAALMEDRVDPLVSRRRSKAVEDLASRQWQRYAQRFVGRELMAVVERERSPEKPGSALTDNFLRLHWVEDPEECPPPKRGELRTFRIRSAGDGTVEGIVV